MEFNYIVVSSKEPELSRDAYYIIFDDKDEAVDFLNTEEYKFRTRYLYDCRNGIPDDFFEKWCLPAETEEEDILNADAVWDDNLNRFTYIADRTKSHEREKEKRKNMLLELEWTKALWET